MSSTAELLRIAGTALSGHGPSTEVFDGKGPRGAELCALLSARNGFFAFESALYVLPDSGAAVDLRDLNGHGASWRAAYPGKCASLFFFAADGFGDLFAIKEQSIVRFVAETGETVHLADTLDAWAEAILRNYRVDTGWPLVHAWQVEHGPLPEGHRLIPKTPFVMGGAYSLENLYALDLVKGLCFRGDIASQIHGLPDGAKVELMVVPKPG